MRSYVVGTLLPAKAFDIAVSGFNGIGTTEHIWILDWTYDSEGHPVRVWSGTQFDPVGGRGYRIAVDENGVPWTRTANSRAAILQNGQWVEVDGDVWDIGIGRQVAWASKTRKKSENGPIVHWNGAAGWSETGCRGFEVAVSASGEPWFTTTGQSGSQIWRLRNGQCERLPGAALDIAVRDDERAWAIGRDNKLYHWREASRTWTQVDVNLSLQTPSALCYRVAVGGSGLPIVTTINGDVFRVTRFWQI